MTIYCTEAPNDADLVRALGSIAVPIPIPHGDAVFFAVSDSPDGSGPPIPIRVLVERKRVGDMVNSIIGGRYLHQLRSAHDDGDFYYFCLVVEGKYRPSPDDGLLEVPYWVRVNGKLQRAWKPTPQAISYSRFDQYLTELDYIAGVIVKRSMDVRETAAIIKALWNNFQDPPSKHTSLHSIYTAPPDRALLHKPSLVRRWAKELDGIGWERSGEVEKHFQTAQDMANADVGDWLSIDGIGKKTAESVVRQMGAQQLTLDR